MTELPQSWSLDGKVAVVTGAARGIGRATVELLKARGAKVVASDRSDAVKDLEAEAVATVTGDVADEAAARRTMALAGQRFGLTSHVRSIDTLARPVRYAGASVPPQVARLVMAKLQSFITI